MDRSLQAEDIELKSEMHELLRMILHNNCIWSPGICSGGDSETKDLKLGPHVKWRKSKYVSYVT